MSPVELKGHALWWNGPTWLQEPRDLWPKANCNPESHISEVTANSATYHHDILDATTNIATCHYDIFEDLKARCSSFHKIQRIVAYMLRFITKARKLTTTHSDAMFFTREEVQRALYQICKHEQNIFFHQEINDVKRTGSVKNTSSLKSLSPFIDKFGTLRVSGRLQEGNMEFEAKHPILLSPKSIISSMIIRQMHIEHKHAGPSLLLAILRQNYWIPSVKNLIKKTVHQCIPCVRYKAKCQQQLMGHLPNYRLELIRAFLKVGVDFAGPISVHHTKGRGQKTYKAYICLFICLSTKAVHIELVSDLSSEAFMAALRRFIARRGCCIEIYSDNGTNFVGASNQLQEEFKKCIKASNQISHYLSKNSITWHFIPPHAPHFGGIWESAIKSTKFHLKRVIGEAILTAEELATLLTEIESILNSRPLCVLSADDAEALTPSHFLIGQPANNLPENDITSLKISHLSRWQRIQHMKQHFWKRWHSEYITSLQQRAKWLKQAPNLAVGNIVLIKEDNIPANKWLLAKIIQLHPGTDGLVRVVTVKTKNGELKRPATKIVKLPIEPDGSRPAVCS